jgi:phage replication O-like protein O
MFSDLQRDKTIQHVRYEMGILDALYRVGNLSGDMYKIVLFIIRKTYGWQKDEALITMGCMASECDMDRTHVCKTIKKLIEINIILRKSAGRKHIYKINDDVQMWGNNTKRGLYLDFPINGDVSLFKSRVVKNSKLQNVKITKLQLLKTISKYIEKHSMWEIATKPVYFGDLIEE